MRSPSEIEKYLSIIGKMGLVSGKRPARAFREHPAAAYILKSIFHLAMEKA